MDVQLVPYATQPHCPATTHKWLTWVVHGIESTEVSKIIDSSDTTQRTEVLTTYSISHLFEVLPHIGSKDFLKFLTFGISSPLCSSQYFKVTDDQQGSLGQVMVQKIWSQRYECKPDILVSMQGPQGH